MLRFQNHYIYKNISLKLGIASKHWFTNIKVLWKGPKACVHMYVCINILLPYYIKVTNLKTVINIEANKGKTVSSEWSDVMWHMMWAVHLWFLRDLSTGEPVRGSWKLIGIATPIITCACSKGTTVNTPHCVPHTKHNDTLPMHQGGLHVSISFEDVSAQSHDTLKCISLAC